MNSFCSPSSPTAIYKSFFTPGDEVSIVGYRIFTDVVERIRSTGSIYSFSFTFSVSLNVIDRSSLSAGLGNKRYQHPRQSRRTQRMNVIYWLFFTVPHAFYAIRRRPCMWILQAGRSIRLHSYDRRYQDRQMSQAACPHRRSYADHHLPLPTHHRS